MSLLHCQGNLNCEESNVFVWIMLTLAKDHFRCVGAFRPSENIVSVYLFNEKLQATGAVWFYFDNHRCRANLDFNNWFSDAVDHNPTEEELDRAYAYRAMALDFIAKQRHSPQRDSA